MSTLTVSSGYPALPYFVNDHGLDALTSVTIASGSAVLAPGTVLRLSGSGKYQTMAVSTSTAVGILFRRSDPTNGDVLAPMQVMGVVRSGSLHMSGTNVAAKALADLADHFIFV